MEQNNESWKVNHYDQLGRGYNVSNFTQADLTILIAD